jgi:hypothetical protein
VSDLPASKRMSFPGASVAKAVRKLGSGSKQGQLLISHSKGTMVMKLDITHLNEDFLFSLGNLDMVDVEVTIRKVGAREISQPHLPRRA